MWFGDNSALTPISAVGRISRAMQRHLKRDEVLEVLTPVEGH
jgi:hypothetical protein